MILSLLLILTPIEKQKFCYLEVMKIRQEMKMKKFKEWLIKQGKKK